MKELAIKILGIISFLLVFPFAILIYLILIGGVLFMSFIIGSVIILTSLISGKRSIEL